MHDDSIIGLSPFERPDPELVAAWCRAGVLGVLDLGRDPGLGAAALTRLVRLGVSGFGVRLRGAGTDRPEPLPPQVSTVVVDPGVDLGPFRDRRVVVEVVSLDEARAAVAAGAKGLWAKGSESGGRVGEETAFVLGQRLLEQLDVPVWIRGGIGLHAPAACLVAGARGVVLDGQLALLSEARTPDDLRAALRSMDGSETEVVQGVRVHARLEGPVPVGQDATFAVGFATRFGSAAALVAGLKRGRARQLEQAAAAVDRGRAPLCDALGIEVPIVQGPMTRVSDRAAFAGAVADAGGLPMLALSLLRGDRVRELLRETAERLGPRPWGVGILGFAPEEIRAEQLAVLREFRPRAIIVAGGRPSQARALEVDGAAVFLHVPSPGLLSLFLDQGATHFVFEGRECGGHVGPRSSFVLWEQAVERLLAFDRPEKLHVLFAGGIHDARSAAMVATLIAPLSARGARVGVLMGTAYLFTREAVETGAIVERYQREVLACERTVLVETGPGYATRCLPTPFVDTIADERARLERGGCKPDEVLQALEKLNEGRLRLASKGLARRGEALVEVDEAAQHGEGMYMVGQAAALVGSVGTVAELHRRVDQGARELVRAAAVARRPERPVPRPARIAIVGMACVFPGAPDLESFWANVVDGVDAIGEVPPERWNPAIYYNPASPRTDVSRSRWGGFLPAIAFDPLAWGIPPRSVPSIDAAQLVALEVARRALDDAGYGDRDFDRERTAVVFGTEASADLQSAYGFRVLYRQIGGELPPELERHLPRLSEDSFPGILANVVAGRVANRLDLGGPNYTVQAACASSLLALDAAVKELTSGTSDVALCGAVDLHNGIADYVLFSSVHALSPRGRCRTFDASADGIVLGEGAACLVLKRLDDAERDGDRIYAVVEAVASGSDGRSLGLTAPRPEGQIRALRRAYERAGISPAEVELIEAHGTGTVVGDRTELSTLTEVFAAAGARPGGCVLGSVKSQIGHTKCAAGLAGVIKAALSIHRRVRPPTLHVESPNPAYDPASSPFALGSDPVPWPGDRRCAGVSAFGFGGTNFHAVLASHGDAAPPEHGVARWPCELLLVRGDGQAGLDRLERTLDEDPGVELRVLAAAWAREGAGPTRFALVARDTADLRDKLASIRAGAPVRGVFVAPSDVSPGEIAFLFPGQGSQRPDMLRDLFVAFPALQGALARAPEHARRMFPPRAWTAEQRAAQQAALTDTRAAQPALGIAGLAVAKVLRSVGIEPAMAAGHSYGELTALSWANVLDEDALVGLSEARARAILEAAGEDPGTMAAVAADASAVARVLADVPGVVIANENGPRQTVVAGPTAAIERSLAAFREAGLGARRIAVACAFHSPVVAGAREGFAAALAGVALSSPAFPVWSNTTTEPYSADVDRIRDRLAEHVVRPVRFVEQIRAMYEAGARTFVEVGPGRVLTDLVDAILADRPHLAVATDAPGRAGIPQLLETLARLAVEGVAIDPRALFAGRDRTARPQVGPGTWWVDGFRARPADGSAIEGGLQPATAPLVHLAREHAPAMSTPDAEPILEYLRSMRALADAQREVMLGYLGQRPAIEPGALIELPSSRVRSLEPAVVAAPVAAAPVAAAATTVEPVADPESVLLGLVADKTGYPREMLGLDLDLEAELSIDSIKRMEILGAFVKRLDGVLGDGAGDGAIEELARLKTLRAILEWLARTAASVPAETPAVQLSELEVVVESLTPVLADDRPFSGWSFAVTADALGISARVVERLCARGFEARAVAADESLGTATALIQLDGFEAVDPVAATLRAFARIREAVAGGVRMVVGVSGRGGDFGRGIVADGAWKRHALGIGGIVRTLTREHPEVMGRIVDLDPAEDPDRAADALVEELFASDHPPEVGRSGARRSAPRLIGAATRARALPSAPRPEAVVLATGGARGITAEICGELARRWRCTLEIVGRVELDPADGPGSEHEDAPALRRRLAAASAGIGPAEIEKTVQRTLRRREVARNLAAMERAGATVRYHALDVRDPAALAALVDDVYRRHGRLDGVLHGAGVLEDRLLAEKSSESFERVFSTKVGSALTLLEHVRPDLAFMVLFASVSGVFGNRGQADYAAANGALDALAWAAKARIRGRVLAVDWGPWDGTGMVSPELRREYARRGIDLIAPADGVAWLLDELASEAIDRRQLVVARSLPREAAASNAAAIAAAE